MTNIIDFPSTKNKEAKLVKQVTIAIDIFDDGYIDVTIPNAKLSEAANFLKQAYKSTLDMLYVETGDTDNLLLGLFEVYNSGRSVSYNSDLIDNVDKLKWVHEQLKYAMSEDMTYLLAQLVAQQDK